MESIQTEQTSSMLAQPQKEHQWLQKLVGEWRYETEALMGPDQPPVKSTGTETVRSLGAAENSSSGALWIWQKGKARCPVRGTRQP